MRKTAIGAAVTAAVGISVLALAPADDNRAGRAVGVLVSRGVPIQTALASVAHDMDAGIPEVAAAAKKTVGRTIRTEESRFTEHIGFIAGPSDRNDVSTSIAWAVCAPLADCGDSESISDCRGKGSQRFNKAGELTRCLADNSKALDFVRLCSGKQERARGARLRLTPWQATLLGAELATKNLQSTTVVDPASDSAWRAALTAAGLSPCD